MRSRSKVHEIRLPLSVVFAGSAFSGSVLCAILAATGMELGLNLTFVGLFLALVLPLGLEIRNRTGRPRRVLILDYRSHQYGQAVARGVRDVLSCDRRRWLTEYKSTGTSTTQGATQWQTRQLQSAVIDEIDGVVLIPGGDDENLWYAVAAAIKAGTFVAVVDTKPPNKIFRDVGIDSPRFVSSRYSQTGALTGELLQAWLDGDPHRRCVLWTGPDDSWPGEERSRNVIYRLAQSDLLDRAELLPIRSWTPDAQRCLDTLKYVENAPGGVAVYCADDENAMALHLYTLTERPALRSSMYIIGCNGTPDDYGNILAVDMRAVDATIDILAEEQGLQTAMLFVKERNGRLSPAERTVFIEPRILIRSSSKARWLDSLFEADPSGEAVVVVTDDEALRTSHEDVKCDELLENKRDDGLSA